MKRSLLILLVTAATLAHGQATRVLFIGNSYVGVNNLPDMTRQLALSLGDTLVVASSNPGGMTFQGHTTDAGTQNLIAQGNWDIVVLQEQSQLPSFPPAQVEWQSLPYAEQLVIQVRTASPCARPTFYMTWGRENGDQQNCANWPPVCTYEGMQERLRDSYLLMAHMNDAECAPAGMAWKQIREDHPSINLYSGDGSHPNVAGSYLVACTLYSTFFRRSTVGATWHSTLDASTAAILQQVASSTVLDSLDTWNIGVLDPVALPMHTDLGGGEVAFSETSTNATQHFWDLGDGSTSNESNFTHSYANDGNYTVTYIAADDCGRADTSIFQVPVIVTGIHEQQARAFQVIPDEHGVSVHNDGDAGTLQLFDLQGRMLRWVHLDAQSGQHLSLTSGQCVLWRFTGTAFSASGMTVVP